MSKTSRAGSGVQGETSVDVLNLISPCSFTFRTKQCFPKLLPVIAWMKEKFRHQDMYVIEEYKINTIKKVLKHQRAQREVK